MKHVRIAAVAAIVLAPLFGVIGAPSADAAQPDPRTVANGVEDFTFESFDAQYYLDTDDSGRAKLRVVETIVALFPDFDQNRGIIRAIPLDYDETPLHLSVVSVTDENGTPVPFERDDYYGFAELALGTDDYVQGRTTYVIEYTMRDVIRHFEDSGGDEFYWDVNGDGWPQPFGSVSATVHLSADLVDALTGNVSCYLGYYGEQNECDIRAEGDTISTRVEEVGAYNTLTVAIGFEGGTVVQPTPPRETWPIQVLPKVLLGASGLWVVIAVLLRTFVLRDARGRGTIIAHYEPPRDSDLLMDAEIIGRQRSGLPALLVDFAVRGLVTIIDRSKGSATSSAFSLELVSGEGANSRELRVLRALFGSKLEPGKRIQLDALPAATGASLYGLPASTTSAAISEGLRAKPKTAAQVWLRRISLVTWLGFGALWVWAVWMGALVAEVVVPALVATVLALAVSIILAVPARLTRAGADHKEYLEGLKLYLTVAEEERFRMLQSPDGALRVDPTDRGAVVKLNERLLPYAVLWGVEDQWVEVLRAQWPDAAPAWLDGTDLSVSTLRGFSASSMSSVRPIVTSSSSGSSWSSSGGSSFSSGSSGGGFSGGGGGGGGGGGR
ncbi:putative membrane protein YgcG [Microbacteriaceae bacterium SG_E_30_P1]|uniref:Membrane protein YgcG n=1 Tax=Antiquaquibacter oligotrophicus TaxID=2880260 RepID=A0ABT6KKV6_9MICO|nr:DUF2207 domain-containing protein [Antiquaquibacter oligotrophicus]MDH6180629.1 putative membrane protein YgcG [Antiquaquibacter oligotrophicus]UDF13641.1 DUF2207 domain-containing protein [Antiquaquibacter oligotrophicus]